jgi:uncharacterized protein (DUF2267 family)
METRTFLSHVSDRLGCDERRAEAITFAVFQELRSRITPEEGHDVAAQLPPPLRRLWATGDREDRAVEKTHRAEFVGRVRARAVLPDDAEAERAVVAVFAELQRALGSVTGREGEAWDVFSQLPKDLKQLWLDAGRMPRPWVRLSRGRRGAARAQ